MCYSVLATVLPQNPIAHPLFKGQLSLIFGAEAFYGAAKIGKIFEKQIII